MKNSVNEMPTFFSGENGDSESAPAEKNMPLGLQHMDAMPAARGVSVQVIFTPSKDQHTEFDYDSN